MKPALVVGNWKMHGTRSEAVKLATGVLEASRRNLSVEVVLAPPFTALAAVSAALRCGAVRLAAQNLHWETEGAFTGEISVSMLRDLDCRYVIVGHSERRRLFGESDAIVAKKVGAALSAGLRPILCVGETLGERRRGRTNGVIARQLRVGPWHISVHRRAAARALELALLEQSSWFADWADLVWGNYRVHAAREMEHRDRIVRLRWE